MLGPPHQLPGAALLRRPRTQQPRTYPKQFKHSKSELAVTFRAPVLRVLVCGLELCDPRSFDFRLFLHVYIGIYHSVPNMSMPKQAGQAIGALSSDLPALLPKSKSRKRSEPEGVLCHPCDSPIAVAPKNYGRCCVGCTISDAAPDPVDPETTIVFGNGVATL